MAIFTYPTLSIGPSGITFGLVSNTMVHVAPLSGATQTVEIPGAKWAGQITYNQLEENDMRLLRGFLAQMRGRANRMMIWDFSNPIPNGVATGTPIVATAAIKGAVTLATSGWTISQTNIMKIGDYFATSTGELKIIVADVNSSATGTALLTFEPPARAAIPLSSAITVNTPKVKCMLIDDRQDQIDVRPPILGSATLTFVEAFT